MDYQTLEVEYKGERRNVNIREIGCLEELREVVRRCFDRLPLEFDVYLKENKDLRLTEEMLQTIRETQLSDFALVIKEIFREVEMD